MIKNNAAAMINKFKLQQAKIKRPGQIKTIRNQLKDTTKRYLSSLQGKRSPFVIALQKKMLSLNHKIISLDDLNRILEDYPEAVSNESQMKKVGRAAILNTTVKALSLYLDNVLVSTFIITDEGIRQFDNNKK
jgi:hypothetical protein